MERSQNQLVYVNLIGRNQENFIVESIPAMRRFALDAGYLGRKRRIVRGLHEVDGTEVREHFRIVFSAACVIVPTIFHNISV